MWLTSLRRLLTGKSRTSPIRRTPPQRRRFKPALEHLEDRITPSQTAGSYSALVGDIAADTAANTSYVIDITNSFTFTAGQQVSISTLAAGSNLTIEGQGGTNYTLTGSSNRLFDVGANQNVTLQDLTLTGGIVSGANAQGGAIYDAGENLTLKTVTLKTNIAFGTGVTANAGNNAQGGGLYVSGGSVNLSNCNITKNIAYAGTGIDGGKGGNAQGGGVYANGAVLTVSGGTVNNNTLNGGNGGTGTASKPGGDGGDAQGGGIYAQGGSVTLTLKAAVSDNTGSGGNAGLGGAGGAGGGGGNAEGGGVFASNTTSVVVKGGAAVNDNTGTAGGGGEGGAGGAGGDGGAALGGGLDVQGGSVTVSGSAAIDVNGLHGGVAGYGGAGGAAAVGGVGGAAEGGGVYVVSASLTVTSGTASLSGSGTAPGINDNTLVAGRGGNGAGGGNGGVGGAAQGGGVFASGSNFAVILGDASAAAVINVNGAIAGNGGSAGGAGGVGGNAGSATGGGVTIVGDKLTLTNATLASNSAIGGNGGNGNTSATHHYVIGNFGDGGDAQGGGLFVSGSGSATVLNSTLANNAAAAGTGTSGGVAGGSAKYGVGGTAQGGGLDAASSTVNVLNSTFADNLLDAGTQVGTSNSVGGHSTGGGTAQGGGLFATGGSLALTNDTIAWNNLVSYTNRGAVAGQGGGVYNATSNTLSLTNTIIALDQLFINSGSGTTYGTANDLPNDLYDTAATSDHDFIGDGTGSTLVNATNGDQVGTDSAPLNPEFVAATTTNKIGTFNSISGQLPGNYGGLVYTLPLNWNTSPALSNGDPSAALAIAQAENGSSAPASSATDARGLPRVIDSTIDIGAVETQVSLTNSASVSSVQAGGTITYTLTVANTESTAANVSLTDNLDPNTTYQSSSGTGWTVGSPPSGSGGSVTATATVAANSSAVLTITVAVNSSISSGTTTIGNTATITPTGNTAAGGRSATAATTVSGPSTTNITSEVGLLRTPAFRDPFAGANAYIQGALLVNESGATLTGPIALVLVGLPSDVTLTNASGTYEGSPYIDIVPANGSWQAGWWHFLIVALDFNTSDRADIHYTPEIVQGI